MPCSWIRGILIVTLQIVGYLAAGLVFSTLAPNTLLYQKQASGQAAGAGFILLSMVIVRDSSALCVCVCALADHETDCMDFLFRIEPPSLAPWLHRFVCPQQRTAWILPKQSTPGAQRVRKPSGDNLDRPNASHVYVSPTQWLRDLVARVRVPGRTRRL